MTIWRMHIACWIPKATNTLCNTHCFSPATWLPEPASMLRHTYIACRVITCHNSSVPLVQTVFYIL